MNISIHISAGIIGMVLAIWLYIIPKGDARHRALGRWFLACMALVVSTALIGVFFFVDRPFLTVVSLQSAYFSWFGLRTVQLKGKPFTLWDGLALLLVLGIGLRFLSEINSEQVLWNATIVRYILVYLFLFVGFDLLRFFFPTLIQHPRLWLFDHIYKMTSAFGALVSAGMGTVLRNWEPYNQIVPAMATTAWLIFCLIYFTRRANASATNEKHSDKSIPSLPTETY